MRIIDRRKDYYDGVQRNGQDPTCVFVRKTEDIEIPKFKFDGEDSIFPIRREWNIPRHVGMHNYIIGFCGKLYPVMHDNRSVSRPGEYGMYDTISHFYYTSESVFKSMYPRLAKKEIPADKKHAINRLDRFFGTESKVLCSLFEEHRVPCFVYDCDYMDYWNKTHKITLNPLLNQFDFQKVVDPYQAFQKIHAFLSGVLGDKEMPMPVHDDELMAEIHGFDRKTSFRAPKGSKPNRKNRKNLR